MQIQTCNKSTHKFDSKYHETNVLHQHHYKTVIIQYTNAVLQWRSQLQENVDS